MKRCKTCRFWSPDKGLLSELRYSVNIAGRRTEDIGYELGTCSSPSIPFYDLPPRNGATTMHGSEYKASFNPAEYFGCVLHKEKEETT